MTEQRGRGAFIAGEWCAATDGGTMQLIDPATGQVARESLRCAASDVDRAVIGARAAYARGDWSQRPVRERARVMQDLAGLVDRDRELLARLDSEDSGRPITEVRGQDLPNTSEALRWFAEAADKLYGNVSTTDAQHLAFTEREPLGVTAAILPWNYPLSNLAWKFGPALLTGNSLIVKPADATPRSALHLASLAEDAGVPPGVLSVVPGDGPTTGARIAEHMDVDAVFFTGSTQTGRSVLAAAAASNFKRTTLEMGGKSPQLLLADALEYGDELIDGLIEAAFLSMGQNCTAGSRILVHAEIADEVIERFSERAAALVIGPPSDEATEIGPLISAKAVGRVDDLVSRTVRSGGRLVTGGTRTLEDSGGFYYAPTVLVDVPASAEIEQTEVFGPVVTISRFTDEAAAIARANDTRYGLAASLWTTRVDKAVSIARRLRAGTVSVNCYSEGDLSTPFGGFGQSGFGGKEKSLAAFDSWSQTKTTWIELRPSTA